MQDNIQAHLEDLDRSHFKVFLAAIQHGEFSVADYSASKDRLLRAAVHHGNTMVANLILDYYEVIREGLSFEERLAMYQLLKEH